ncbi:MAG: hypothetical protein DMG21_18265 [Acidobacteria bacterium]|nr:MAG: hypothetical protein DMG21_18265 [Acidobacteriota bacterium]
MLVSSECDPFEAPVIPAKAESILQVFENALWTHWIPAFAGMTLPWSAHVRQMTPVPGAGSALAFNLYTLYFNL